MSRAARPQCHNMCDVHWSSCLTGGTSASGAFSMRIDQGVWCRWTVRVAYLCWLGSSSRISGGAQPSLDGVGTSRFLSPLLGALCSLGRGPGCWQNQGRDDG